MAGQVRPALRHGQSLRKIVAQLGISDAKRVHIAHEELSPMRICAFVLTCCFLSGVHAQDQTQKALVKSKAGEIARAMTKGDYVKVAELTYPKVIDVMGGLEKASSLMQQEMKKLEANGFRVIAVDIGEPGEFITADKLTFVVVPSTTVTALPGGKELSKGYLLGISTDPTRTWHFVDGFGLANPEARALLLPKLPDNLKLPVIPPPEFIKDKY